MKTIRYTWNDLTQDINHLALKISLSGWRPDYIVGIARGGCVPAVMLSHLLQIPMRPLIVSLRDDDLCESNCWMSEDAFGYGIIEPKRILIVDDINDTGATFDWIKQDWQQNSLPNDPRWNSIWHNSVKFATLFDNQSSQFKAVDFAANYINKAEQDVYVCFPWEDQKSDFGMPG